MPPARQYIARISVRESHSDGTGRITSVTKIVDESTTIRDLYFWREKRIHQPLDGDFASIEIVITPDDGSDE